MQVKHNSMKRWLVGVVCLLAVVTAASRLSGVAASNGHAAPAANMLASLQLAAVRAAEGSVEVARDLRSIYSLYQLQTSPEITPVAALKLADTESVPQVILCDLFQKTKTADAKKKSSI